MKTDRESKLMITIKEKENKGGSFLESHLLNPLLSCYSDSRRSDQMKGISSCCMSRNGDHERRPHKMTAIECDVRKRSKQQHIPIKHDDDV